MANILILDDDPDIRLLLAELTEDMGHVPSSAGTLAQGLAMAQDGAFDLILLDLDFPEGNGLDILPDLLKLPGVPEVIIITGTGTSEGAEIAFNHGAWDFVQKPFLVEEVSLPIVRALQYRSEKAVAKPPTVLHRKGIWGESAIIHSCLEDVAKAAVTDSSVLVLGETGTGKELFARAIHDNSRRAKGNFVVIDCGALSETLFESILFGHEKGAFTGAVDKKKGLIAEADGGTLFLDEIGELPTTIQKSLLRTLQERRVRPVGGNKEISVDFRLVAATNRDLEKMAEEETFRADLLFRLRGIELNLPPLRERTEDIRTIAKNKIDQLSKQQNVDLKGISSSFLEVLEEYSWPGNVRELVHLLEHSLANSGMDPTLVQKHLPPKYRATLIAQKSGETNGESMRAEAEILATNDNQISLWNDFRTKMESSYLRRLIVTARGDWREACHHSGLSKTRLYELLKKHGLSLS